jgi:hypothetical protein
MYFDYMDGYFDNMDYMDGFFNMERAPTPPPPSLHFSSV